VPADAAKNELAPFQQNDCDGEDREADEDGNDRTTCLDQVAQRTDPIVP
jgi:hypothetical protein